MSAAPKQTGMVGLMIYKIALDGSKGGFSGALSILSSADKLREAAVAAKKWCSDSIAAVRQATDPNPWRNSTDDEIADEILRQIEARKP